MKKGIRIVLIILGGLALLVALVLGGFNLYLRIAFSEFYSGAQTHGNVPGIADGFIHQGISYEPESGKFLACGYMNDGSASRIYLFDSAGEAYVTLLDVEGKPSKVHAGGLSYWDGIVFLTGGDHILGYSYQEIREKAANGGAVAPLFSFHVRVHAAFCYVEGDSLYVGEFYREQNYKTEQSHHMPTPVGEQHHALLLRYDLAGLKNPPEDPVPTAAYSIPDLAQGMCFTPSGKLCISTSYAVAPSHILVYDLSRAEPTKTEMTLDDGETAVPLYYLDSAALAKDLALFPMSEELVLVDGRVYIMNESASAKYLFGKFTGGNKLYSIVID